MSEKASSEEGRRYSSFPEALLTAILAICEQQESRRNSLYCVKI